MELSKRLHMNAELVPDGSVVADIGCDHGYVSIYLAEKKKCRVVAMDVKEGPLSMARKNIAACGMSDRIACRQSDGMEKLQPGEVDTLLMAGMGGMLIVDILAQYPDVLKQIRTLVLQPQSDCAKVRRFVLDSGFVIDREAFCVDAGKDYVAVRARRTRKCDGEEEADGGKNINLYAPYSEAELLYGRFLPSRGDETYCRYLIRERVKYEKIIQMLRQKKSGGCKARISELMHRLDLLEESIQICENGGVV